MGSVHEDLCWEQPELPPKHSLEPVRVFPANEAEVERENQGFLVSASDGQRSDADGVIDGLTEPFRGDSPSPERLPDGRRDVDS
jgi:hypothetical protein